MAEIPDGRKANFKARKSFIFTKVRWQKTSTHASGIRTRTEPEVSDTRARARVA